MGVNLNKMNMKRQCMLIVLASAALLWSAPFGQACTGITQRAADGSRIVGRTIEWGGTNLNSRYAIVPRGYEQSSFFARWREGYDVQSSIRLCRFVGRE